MVLVVLNGIPFQMPFFLFVIFSLKSACEADVWFVLSLSAVMFSNIGEPVTHWS
jgi:hypothetical protein